MAETKHKGVGSPCRSMWIRSMDKEEEGSVTEEGGGSDPAELEVDFPHIFSSFMEFLGHILHSTTPSLLKGECCGN